MATQTQLYQASQSAVRLIAPSPADPWGQTFFGAGGAKGRCKGACVHSARTARAQRTHDRKKLRVFATSGNILADTNHTTPPQHWTALCFTPPQHKRCQCTQPQQRHMQKQARRKFVLNSTCERCTPLRLGYVRDMHHSTWRPHPQPLFGYVQPDGDFSCFAMGFLCCRLMRRTNQNYLHLQ